MSSMVSPMGDSISGFTSLHAMSRKELSHSTDSGSRFAVDWFFGQYINLSHIHIFGAYNLTSKLLATPFHCSSLLYDILHPEEHTTGDADRQGQESPHIASNRIADEQNGDNDSTAGRIGPHLELIKRLFIGDGGCRIEEDVGGFPMDGNVRRRAFGHGVGWCGHILVLPVRGEFLVVFDFDGLKEKVKQLRSTKGRGPGGKGKGSKPYRRSPQISVRYS